MLADQLSILEKKEQNLLALCNDPTTYVTTAKVQSSLNVIHDEFDDLNDILKDIDIVSEDIKSKLLLLDIERKNVLKLKESLKSLSSFKVAVIQGSELIKLNKYNEIFLLFSQTSNIPDFKRLEAIPPKTEFPIQQLFVKLQDELLVHLNTVVPDTIPDIIQLLNNYFAIYKQQQGISVFIKSIKVIFDAQLTQIQQQGTDAVLILIKCMDAIHHLLHKVHQGLSSTNANKSQYAPLYSQLFVYFQELIVQLFKKWISARQFGKLVAELKTLDLKQRGEDLILYLDCTVDLKDLSKYCNEMSSVISRYYKLAYFSELNGLYDLKQKQNPLFQLTNDLYAQYKIMEVVYIQSCFSKFFLNFTIEGDSLSIVEDSVYLLKSAYSRIVGLGNTIYIDDMLYGLATISNKLLIDNLVKMFEYSLKFDSKEDELYMLPILLLKEIDDFNNKLDGIHNTVIDSIRKNYKESDLGEQISNLFVTRFDWNFKNEQMDLLIKQFYNNHLKRGLTTNCRKLFRDIVKNGNLSKYVIPMDINNTMLESKLIGNNPVLEVILNNNFGEFSAFKNDVFLRLFLESADIIVDKFTEAVFESCMNSRGAAFLERDTRSLMTQLDNYFHTACSSEIYFQKHFLLRAKFSKLLEISIIVNCSSIVEASEMIHDPSYQFILNAGEIRKCLLLRNDFKLEEVAKLKI